MGKKSITGTPHPLRKSDAAIFNAIMRSVKDKIKYMEQVFQGPRKRRRKKRSPRKPKGAKNVKNV